MDKTSEGDSRGETFDLNIEESRCRGVAFLSLFHGLREFCFIHSEESGNLVAGRNMHAKYYLYNFTLTYMQRNKCMVLIQFVIIFMNNFHFFITFSQTRSSSLCKFYIRTHHMYV